MDNTNTSSSKRSKIFLIIGAIVVLAITAILGLMQLERTKSPQTTDQVDAREVTTVLITSDGYVPETIIIKKGQQVKWINQDSRARQIAPDPHPIHSSLPDLSQTDAILPEQIMTFTFEEAGTFSYHDEQNPLEFKGVVIVE